jgi:hypothetical protein
MSKIMVQENDKALTHDDIEGCMLVQQFYDDDVHNGQRETTTTAWE